MRASLFMTGVVIATIVPAGARAPATARHVVRIAMTNDAVTPAEHTYGDRRSSVRRALADALSSDFTASSAGQATSSVVSVAPFSTIVVPSWMRGLPQTANAGSAAPPACAPIYRPSGLLTTAGERRRESYYAMMSGIACEYGIPVGLFDALIIRETAYDPMVRSPKLAFGLTQLMSATARSLGVDRYNAAQNLRGGALYLRQQLDRFGAWHLALAAYNAGPDRIRDGQVPRIAETRDYVGKVLAAWGRLTLPARANVFAVGAAGAPVASREVTIASF